MNSKNTRDVMITFHPPTLKTLDVHCKRTGLKRSTAVMRAVASYLTEADPLAPIRDAAAKDLHPQAAAKPTGSLLKTKLRRR